MRTLFLGLAAFAATLPAFPALTPEQKVADLTQVAAMYAKYYGPYNWKLQILNYDMMDMAPWIDRAVKTTSDLEFMDLLVEYVASLNDAHDNIYFPNALFTANLGFTVDIYDGKVLIDSVNRGVLPASRYPFDVGDELVSVDGAAVADLIRKFRKYSIAANERSTSRVAAGRITSRSQQRMPRAHEIGDSAALVVKRGGEEQTYTVPWIKSGIPVLEAGAIPGFHGKSEARFAAAAPEAYWDDTLPEYMRPLARYMDLRVAEPFQGVLNSGGRSPIFALPSNFVRRLGGGSSDNFYSGTYEFDGLKIGYIRVPSMTPSSATSALAQYDVEINYMQDRTDGLVIDVMRNPGGSVTYAESLLQRIIPRQFRTMGFEIRATGDWIADFDYSVQMAELYGAPDWALAMLKIHLRTLQQSYAESRGVTGPIPLNANASMELLPAAALYRKPIIVLVDEMTASGGDMFAAVFQDAARGQVFGYRTMGAGGNVVTFDGTTYTEGLIRVTQSLMSRKEDRPNPEFGPNHYVENAGVTPDVVEDYMTADNLMNRGKTFVDSFSKAVAAHIRSAGTQ